jgi:hypothetical protein
MGIDKGVHWVVGCQELEECCACGHLRSGVNPLVSQIPSDANPKPFACPDGWQE